MSLFPAYFGARKSADDEPAPVPEPENEARSDIFNLIPPRAEQKYQPASAEISPKAEAAAAPAAIEGVAQPVTATDLTRLSIDNEGRLYWDGKPVETKRRLVMSRGQVIGTSLIALFIIVGALGSAIQAAATVHDWACRAGWASECRADPTPVGSIGPRLDIPL